MKKIVTLFVLLCCALSVSAIPARRGTITYTQPDGTTVQITRHGDEWGHWATNAAGQVVRLEEDGFYRVQEGVDAATVAQAASIRRAARRRSHTASQASGHIAVGQKHFLVILVEFSDQSFTVSSPKTAFTNLLNQNGYSTNGATGSARDFYYDNSKGYFEPVFDVYGPYKLSNKKSYYGGNDYYGNDKNPEQAIIDGCKGLDSQIDFSKFDNDGDGEVDLVFMYYAGYGEADSDDEDAIWPHQWELSSANKSLTLDGKKIDRYACTNELDGYGSNEGKMCGIGTACHEFGHAMGLPDFYDTDYDTNGEAAALFEFSTMCGGAYNNDGRTPPYFNIEERIMLGWLDESAIQEFPTNGNYTLASVHENLAYKTPTDMAGEYFVYECRGTNGWDQYIPAAGLVVYHVDKSSRQVNIGSSNVKASELWSNWGAYNAINENGSHPCFYIVPAADQSNLMFGYEYYSEYQQYYYSSSFNPQIPFPGSKNIKTYTAKSWNGVNSDISLSNIAYSNNQVTFTVSGIASASVDYNTIANPGKGVYAAGSSFALELVPSESRPAQSVKWYLDDVAVSGTSVKLTAGKHVIEAVVTLSSGDTDTVTLEVTAK